MFSHQQPQQHNNGRSTTGGASSSRSQGQSQNAANPHPHPPSSSPEDINKSNQISRLQTQYLPNGEIDNSCSVISRLSSLYYTKAMTDITLVIGRSEFAAHRLILCASSDVFQAMLTSSSSWVEATLPRVELKESLECAAHFEPFLKYLYTGVIRLELNNVLHLLTLADKYDVVDLLSLTLHYIRRNIPSGANGGKLIQWYTHLARRGHDKEAVACSNFIKWNFEFISGASDFLELDPKLMINILRADDLVVYDEYRLFQCVSKWIEAQLNQLNLEDPSDLQHKSAAQLVASTFDCLRFQLMSPRQLADLVLNPITQKYKEYFMDKMAVGVAFHSAKNQLIRSSAIQVPHPHPRHYFSDKWSICLQVDGVASLPHYASKTHVFSTPLSFSENNEKQAEWVVDFYPKGVCYNKSYLIVWQGTLECPPTVLRTVRLSVQCKNCDEDGGEEEIRVQIGVLIAGVVDNVEHVRSLIKKNYIFSGRDQVLNFDDLVPYDEIVQSLLPPPTGAAGANIDPPLGGGGGGSSPHTHTHPIKSTYLCNDSLKLRIVITPIMAEIKTT